MCDCWVAAASCLLAASMRWLTSAGWMLGGCWIAAAGGLLTAVVCSGGRVMLSL